MKEIFTALSIFIIYIFWLPITILKDISAVLYTPFDIQRFLTSYQNMFNNLFNLSKVHKKLNESKNEPLETSDTKPYEKTSIGFKTFEIDDIDINDAEEYYEEEEIG